MSFTESEELNKWIHRSYEIGKREERERIIQIIESRSNATSRDGLIALIKGESYECECDPCSDENCTCRTRCSFCVKKDENR